MNLVSMACLRKIQEAIMHLSKLCYICICSNIDEPFKFNQSSMYPCILSMLFPTFYCTFLFDIVLDYNPNIILFFPSSYSLFLFDFVLNYSKNARKVLGTRPSMRKITQQSVVKKNLFRRSNTEYAHRERERGTKDISYSQIATTTTTLFKRLQSHFIQ